MRTHRIMRIVAALASLGAAVLALSGTALAQVQVTPNVSTSPSTDTTPWIVQMAVGAGILGAIIALAVVAGYVRNAPRFYGREEAPKPPPGYRPPLLAGSRTQTTARPASAAAAAPATAAAGAGASGGAGSAPAASAVATAEPATEAEAATPEPEAAGAEAAPEAAAAPEPEAAAAEAAPEAAAAPEPEAAAAEAAPEAAAPEAAAPAAAPSTEAATTETAPAASHASGGAQLDRETFDRVLQEQLDNGVDRRVAEGRARAAAVVAARKKAQG